MSTEISPENVIVCYFFMCIVAAIISREINRRIPLIPYTPMLILLGLLIGATDVWGQLSEGVQQIARINPHGILMILLPVLIFESSYNARLSILKDNLLQVLLMAVPGVIMTALLLAVVLKPILGYEDDSLNWPEALVLGCILGTTDPVAVVALLKELGAPLRTNTLIEMESLLNDGVAMVFFTIFLESAKGKDVDAGMGIKMFFQLAFGGPALGIAWGIGGYIVSLFVRKGKTFFMSLILLSCYSIFYVAEKHIAVSGLLGLVAMGFFYSVFLKNQMTQEQEHSVHSILGYIQHIDETFLFFLTGTIIGDQLINTFIVELEGADVWRMALFYLLLMVVRVMMVCVMAGIVRLTGQYISIKEMILQIWGGLRGALSLALALVVFQDNEVVNPRARTLILFHTACLAALTLIFNGSTSTFIVKWTRLIPNQFERDKYKEIFEREVKEVGRRCIDEQKRNETLSLTFWDGVLNLLKFKTELDPQVSLSLPLMRYKCLRVLIDILMGHQGEQYLSKSIYNAVTEASEVSCENCVEPIDIFTHTSNNLTSINFLNYCRAWINTEFVGKLFDVLMLFQLEENFCVVQLLIQVLSLTIAQLQQQTEDQETRLVIIAEMEHNLKQALDLMFQYKSRFPREIQKISQRQAAMKILVAQTHYVDEYMGSFITQKEGNELKTFFFNRIEETNSFRMLLELDSGPEYILESSFRGFLSDKELIQICNHYEMRQTKEGDNIIDINQPEQHCYLIMEGIIEEEIKVLDQIQVIQYSAGNLVGVPNVIDQKVESVVVLKAKTDCQYMAIPILLIRDIFNTNKKFEQLCYKESLATFLVLYHTEKHHFNKFIHLQLYNWAMKAKLHKVTGTQEMMLSELILPQYGAFVFQGEWLSLDGKFRFGQWDYIEPMKMQLKPTKPSIVLIFSHKLQIGNHGNEQHTERTITSSHEESMLLEHPVGH